jgi:hypothetical protein
MRWGWCSWVRVSPEKPLLTLVLNRVISLVKGVETQHSLKEYLFLKKMERFPLNEGKRSCLDSSYFVSRLFLKWRSCLHSSCLFHFDHLSFSSFPSLDITPSCYVRIKTERAVDEEWEVRLEDEERKIPFMIISSSLSSRVFFIANWHETRETCEAKWTENGEEETDVGVIDIDFCLSSAFLSLFPTSFFEIQEFFLQRNSSFLLWLLRGIRLSAPNIIDIVAFSVKNLLPVLLRCVIESLRVQVILWSTHSCLKTHTFRRGFWNTFCRLLWYVMMTLLCNSDSFWDEVFDPIQRQIVSTGFSAFIHWHLFKEKKKKKGICLSWVIPCRFATKRHFF